MSTTNIIQRLRDQLPTGASIVEEEDYVIIRAPGQRPIIYNALTVSCQELEQTAQQIVEMAKAASFRNILCPDCGTDLRVEREVFGTDDPNFKHSCRGSVK